MKKLYFAALFAIMTAGIFVILKYGVKPQPEGIMKPSFFAQPEEIGAVVYRRFYVPIEQHKLVVFGIPPQPIWHQEILRGFIKAAALEHRPFEVLIEEEDMPALNQADLPVMETVRVRTNTSTQAEFAELLAKYKAQGKRILVHTASVFSSHYLKGNAILRYEQMSGENLFSITSAPLALQPNQEHLVDPPCVGGERDEMGTSDLGCAILQAGRRFYRKKLPQDQYVAIMNHKGPAMDYLLMVSAPGQDRQSK